jgi:hypothetical protein
VTVTVAVTVMMMVAVMITMAVTVTVAVAAIWGAIDIRGTEQEQHGEREKDELATQRHPFCNANI